MDDSQSTVDHIMPCSRVGPHHPAASHPSVSNTSSGAQLNHVHLPQPSIPVPSQYFGARLDASWQSSEASQQCLKQSAQAQSHAVGKLPSGGGSIPGDSRKAASGYAPPRDVSKTPPKDVSKAPPGDGIRPPCGGVSKAASWGIGKATLGNPSSGGVTKAAPWGLGQATPRDRPSGDVSRSPSEGVQRPTPQEVIKPSFGGIAKPPYMSINHPPSRDFNNEASAPTDQLKHNGPSGKSPQAVVPLGALPRQSSTEQHEKLAGQVSISHPSITQQLPGKLSWPSKQTPTQTQAAQSVQADLSGRRPVSEKLPTAASQVHMQLPSLPALYI